MTDRYVGKPFLRLLECYVLDAIGELEPHYAETLRRMEPKLGETYGMKGTWREIVSVQMVLPESLPSKILAIWKTQLEAARAQNATIAPSQFAADFVDQNFPNAVAGP